MLQKDEALSDANGRNSLLEQKNKSLEKRIEQLEARLDEQQNLEIQSMQDSERKRIEEGGKACKPAHANHSIMKMLSSNQALHKINGAAGSN